MAKTVIVKLTDDLDGGDADETVRFGLDGTSYEIDLSATNAATLRDALKRYTDAARLVGASGSRSSRPAGAAGAPTAYSKLSAEEKARFRKWADMADARRISDARVQSWVDAGKP
jgi:nucleoid-associated protein Lsr2